MRFQWMQCLSYMQPVLAHAGSLISEAMLSATVRFRETTIDGVTSSAKEKRDDAREYGGKLCSPTSCATGLQVWLADSDLWRAHQRSKEALPLRHCPRELDYC